jgi:transcriptional regulator with XRE-family HTH domain
MSDAPTVLRPVPRLAGTTGQRIQSARGFHRWNQDLLLEAMRAVARPGERVPVRRTLSNWENDAKSPTVREIQLVARATRFPVEDFVAEDQHAPTPGPTGPGVAMYPPWDSNPEPAD